MGMTTQYKYIGTYLRADQVNAMRDRAFIERRSQAELYRIAVDLLLSTPLPEPKEYAQLTGETEHENDH
jgi:hypothetical protein